ncbi:MAG: serine--tRNA ligase, partial [Acidimicrobiales bacterium]
MIDLRRLRTEPDVVLAALARRHIDLAPLQEVIELDRVQRDLSSRRDDIRNQVNQLSAQVGRLHKEGRGTEAGELQATSRQLGEQEKTLDAQADEVAGQIRQALLVIPNLPHPDAPDGASDADNPELRQVGFDPAAYQAHQRVPHWEIGEELGILDLQRGAKLSGSMFVMYRGGGAALVRALIQLGLDR